MSPDATDLVPVPVQVAWHGEVEDGHLPLRLATPFGQVPARLTGAAGAQRGIVVVGGVGGGFDTPARRLYPRLAARLAGEDVTGLRVAFRRPGELDACVDDLLAGVSFLAVGGVRHVALVGHSFGGAVAIRAAQRAPQLVRAVVALASQSYGTEAAADLGPASALLLIHGARDSVLPAECSRAIHRAARQPKRLVLLDGAGHGLDEAADEVERETLAWLKEHLRTTPG